MISEIADYAILMLDTEGNIQNWNIGAERIKGYKADEIVGKNFRLFYTEEDRKSGKPDKLIKIALEKGRAEDEGWRVRKDGSAFWGSIVITTITDKQGHLIGFSKITRDLTEQKKTENALKAYAQDLENKNRETEQFAYIASHDLQEPLRTITSLTELLSQNYADQIDDTGQQMMQFITQATGRMRQLIQGLLEYSRIGRESQLTTIDCNRLVADIKNDLGTLINENEAIIEVGPLPAVQGYEMELRLMFQNLLTNALKFRKQDVKPHIFITASHSSSGWEFAIRDNGIGIATEHLKKIFVIFQRLHRRGEYEGTGIGLAHCHKIAELHKGHIWGGVHFE